VIIEVYSDGSGTTGDKPGGYGYVICVDGVKVREGSGHLPKATNNVAEITAAIRGLQDVIANLPAPTNNIANGVSIEVTLISDSQLVLNFANGTYQCRKRHLVPYYIALRKVYGQLNATTRWVKGHAGDTHNERCDVLAKAARENQSNEVSSED
jgi:ribonuclease HI